MHDELIALLMAQECSKNENNVEQSEEVVPTHYRSLPSLRAVRQCAIAIHLIARTRQNLYRLRWWNAWIDALLLLFFMERREETKREERWSKEMKINKMLKQRNKRIRDWMLINTKHDSNNNKR